MSTATAPVATASVEVPEIEISRRRWLRNACYGFAGMTALTSVGAVWTESMGLQVRKVTLQCPRLPPAFRGYRVVQISDVHSGPYMGLESMRTAREAAEALRPDLVVFTGDQVDTHWNQLPAFLEAFNGLRGPDGVFAIMGNHDYISGWKRVRAGLDANGIPVLVNQHVRIRRGNQAIALAGLDDLWHGIELPDPVKAYTGSAPDDFRLCLMHNPNSFEVVANAGADLMLAGHTHGGQINLVADCLSPARLFSPYVQGLYQYRHAQMYVNVGVGFVGIPVRIGVPAEIVEFTLV
jgi:predicted MPP superfamily phosphohydrolase